MSKKSERTKRRHAPERPELRPLFADESDEGGDVPTQDPVAEAHRRVREGELYYVSDDTAPEGWSVVEISGIEDGPLAAFAVGQLEAIPLEELEDRLLGPVAGPATVRRAA